MHEQIVPGDNWDNSVPSYSVLAKNFSCDACLPCMILWQFGAVEISSWLQKTENGVFDENEQTFTWSSWATALISLTASSSCLVQACNSPCRSWDAWSLCSVSGPVSSLIPSCTFWLWSLMAAMQAFVRWILVIPSFSLSPLCWTRNWSKK